MKHSISILNGTLGTLTHAWSCKNRWDVVWFYDYDGRETYPRLNLIRAANGALEKLHRERDAAGRDDHDELPDNSFRYREQEGREGHIQAGCEIEFVETPELPGGDFMSFLDVESGLDCLKVSWEIHHPSLHYIVTSGIGFCETMGEHWSS